MAKNASSTPAPIDPRGPRTNQAVLATALVLGFVFGQTWVAPLFAVVLLLGAAFGPKWGPVLRFYGAVIRPRLAPPRELEDPRPPRFAAAVGVVFLVAATISFALGATVVGWVLSLMVAALAALAAITGLCVGCEMYVLAVRLRGGVRIVTFERSLDDDAPTHRPAANHGKWAPLPADLRGDAPTWVVFTTEYCAVCPSVIALIAAFRPFDRIVTVDVAERLDLAAQYRVRRAPTVLRANADGTIVARLSGAEAVRAELERDEAAALAG